MKPLVLIPPAQAEALFDAQDEGHDDYLIELCRCDRTASLPWRDDDGDEGRVFSDPLIRLPLPVPSFGLVR